MLSLNLVSNELKEEVKLKRIYGLLKKMNFILILTVVMASFLLLAAKFILQNNFNKVVEQTTLLIKNSQGYNNRIREINSQIDAVSKIQNDFVVWSSFLKNLAEKTPAGVTLSFLKINKSDHSVKIKGKADSRDDLLSLKEKLLAEETLKEVELPIKNILTQKDIDFEINAKLK